MKKLLLIGSLVAAMSAPAIAAGKNLGVGFTLGDPTGFSAKYWTSGTTALDFSLGWKGNYWYAADGWYDDRCYRGSFRNANQPYCADQAFGPGYNDGYGWRILHFHADYLFHNFSAIRASEKFPLYYGPGLMVNFVHNNYAQFGGRGNFGIAWLPRRAPLDVFFEIGPGFFIFPYPDFDLDAALGTRFYF